MLCFDCVCLSRRPGDGAVEQQAGVAVQSLGEKPAKQTAHLLGEEVRVKQEIREAECLVRWLTFVRTCQAQAQEKVRPDDMRWCWRDRIGRIRRYKWIKSSLDFIWTRFSSLATQKLPTKTELQLTSPPASSHWEVIFFSSPRNLFLSSATQLRAEAKKLYMTAVHGVQKSSSISPQKPERPETPKVWTKRASKTVQRRFLKPPPAIPQITSRCSQSYYFFDKCYCLVINLSLKQT